MVFDIVIILLTVGMVIYGLQKGAIFMIFDVCHFLLSIFLVPYIQGIVEHLLGNKYGKVFTYIVSFVFIFIVLHIIVRIIHKFLETAHLGGINKLVGALLGLVLSFGITFFLMTVMLFMRSIKSVEKTLDTSRVIYYVSINTKKLNKYFPKTIENRLDEFNFKNQNLKLKGEVYEELKKGVKTNED